MPRSLAALALALTLATTPAPLLAQPQMPCVPRAQALDLLAQSAQQVHARGLAGRVMLELFVKPDTEDWTLIVTYANGRSCLWAKGIAFSHGAGLLPAKGRAL